MGLVKTRDRSRGRGQPTAPRDGKFLQVDAYNL
jgi:hypothetical protein